MPVLALIATLMNATGIELDARRDLDLDRELRTVGVANLIAGAGGGVPGYHNLSLTVLASRLGTANAIVGVTVAAFSAVAIAFGSADPVAGADAAARRRPHLDRRRPHPPVADPVLCATGASPNTPSSS